MIRLLLLALLLPALARAQSSVVDPADLTLEVRIENGDVAPYQQEMVLLTIHGIYRRHITLEKMEQPDLTGFNWMQLGQDHWYDSQLDGQKVKNMIRRMALFPEQAGELTIGPFTHHLTLTDEGDDWFPHDIRSDPITLNVQPAPPVDDWWFPVRRLEISDQWSNAPDQLQEGEGVLRVITIKAVGVAPDMIPPMPELNSPSAMIFPHPEKRLVELSPEGPVSMAFWRWTIRPSNPTSAILEPISFDYFDTVNRVARTVTISAQRVAMSEALLPDPVPPPVPARLSRAPLMAGFALALVLGLGAMVLGRRFGGWAALRRHALFDPDRRALGRAARRGDAAGLRRAAARLDRRAAPDPARARILHDLDMALFSRTPQRPDLNRIAAEFLRLLPWSGGAAPGPATRTNG